MSKAIKRPAIVIPTVDEDRAITAAAKSDPDAEPLSPRQLKAMVPTGGVLRQYVESHTSTAEESNT